LDPSIPPPRVLSPQAHHELDGRGVKSRTPLPVRTPRRSSRRGARSATPASS
jgi:hypothetical protein